MSINQYLTLAPQVMVFVRVVQAGSFSAAAEKMGTTPSSVSRQVASLEKTLQLTLLERTTRRQRLTPAGAEVYEYGMQMLNASQSVTEISERYTAIPQGRVRIAAPREFGFKMLAPHIATFLRAYPQVDVQLCLTDHVVDLIDDEFDLIVRITDTPPEGLAARPLMRVGHVLCASQSYLQQRGEPQHPFDLAHHDCLYLGEHPGDNNWSMKHRETGEVVEVSVHGRYAVNNCQARLEGMCHDLGIGCLPYITAYQALANESVVEVLPEWEYTTSYYGMAWILYYPNRYLPSRCRVLIDYLAAQLDENRRPLDTLV